MRIKRVRQMNILIGGNHSPNLNHVLVESQRCKFWSLRQFYSAFLHLF
jgi:hypothetical protein